MGCGVERAEVAGVAGVLAPGAGRAFFESALASAGMGPFRDISERERRVGTARWGTTEPTSRPRRAVVA